MDSIIVTLNALLPLFVVMSVGYLARALGHISCDEAQRFSSVIFRYFISVKVFIEIYRAGEIDLVHDRLLQFVLVMLILLSIAVYFTSLAIDKRPDYRGSIFQALYRNNYAAIGLIIIAFLFPSRNIAPASLVLLIVVPCYNGLSAIVLESFRNKNLKPTTLVIRSLKNPLVIATLLALAFNKANLALPGAIVSSMDIIAKATSGLVLFFFGASFRFAIGSYKRELVICSVLRLIVIPAIGLTLGVICNFRGVELATILGILISPPSTTSYPVSLELGANAELTAQFIVFGSMLSLISIFGWILLSISLGLLY